MSGEHGLRTVKSSLMVALPIAISIALLIHDTAAQSSASPTITPAANEIKSPKKAGAPHDSNKLGVVTDVGNDDEGVFANEVAELVARGQETGPHGEVLLRVAATFGSGGLQNIHDVLALTDSDMSIVLAPLLDRAPAALGRGDLRKSIVYIAPLFEEEFHLLAGPSIRNVKDLAGKTVNLGVKNGVIDFLGREIFDNLGLDVKVVNLDQLDAVDAISKGEIEADLLLAGKPLEWLAKYTSDIGLRLIAIPRLDTLAKDFLPATLTYEDYPNLIPRGTNVETVGARLVLIAYNWPRGSARYNLMDFFVRTLFSRFSELQSGPHHPKWRDVDLAANLPGWPQFPPARLWLDQRKSKHFLSKRGIDASADQTRLLQSR